jgi:nicotinate-nucleotide adenylyltransferase
MHIGHLIVADDAAGALGLDRVLLIPAGTHPLKRSAVEASGELRLEMVRAVASESELFVADDRELRRPGPSYTVDTLRALRRENPGAELFLLVGTDILTELDRWHQAQELPRLARVTVMSRAEVDDTARPTVEIEFETVRVPHVAISSTEIRRRVRDGRPFRYLVPPSTYRIIEAHSLYKERD